MSEIVKLSFIRKMDKVKQETCVSEYRAVLLTSLQKNSGKVVSDKIDGLVTNFLTDIKKSGEKRSEYTLPIIIGLLLGEMTIKDQIDVIKTLSGLLESVTNTKLFAPGEGIVEQVAKETLEEE